ncbi:MAG: hypothetical protein ACK5M3_14195 [Dysgonomonas sp.]
MKKYGLTQAELDTYISKIDTTKWDLTKGYSLCAPVSCRCEDKVLTSPYQWEFEKSIYKIIGLDIETSDKIVANLTIYLIWHRHSNLFVCSSSNFNVINGSILKLAVQSAFTSFIECAIYDWYVPLNRIDKFDGRTLLDYVRDEMEKAKDTSGFSILSSYYRVLRKVGAKHKSEMSSAEIDRMLYK